jgi:hypothetical protein
VTTGVRITWLVVHLAAIALGIWAGLALFRWAT